MKRILVPLLFIVVSSANAKFGSPTPVCATKPIYNVDFYHEDLLEKFPEFKNMQNVRDATFNYLFDLKRKTKNGNNEFGSCSGFFTSNSGHFFSALHCMRSCLLETGYLIERSPDVYQRTSKPFPAECSVHYRGREVKMKIMASGDCFSAEYWNCSLSNDFVLGQIVDVNTDCASLHASELSVGNKAVISAFPQQSKNRLFNSDGHAKYFSDGQVLPANLKTCRLVVKDKDGNLQDREVKVNEIEDSIWRMSGDTMPGSSGGAVADEQGNVIGLVVGSTGHELGGVKVNEDEKDFDCRGKSLLNPIQGVLSNLSKKLSTEQLEQILKCKN